MSGVPPESAPMSHVVKVTRLRKETGCGASCGSPACCPCPGPDETPAWSRARQESCVGEGGKTPDSSWRPQSWCNPSRKLFSVGIIP